MKTLAFFVRINNPKLLDIVGFYRDDIRALQDLGFNVMPVTRVRDLLRIRATDGVFVWWFGFGFFAVLLARILGKPAILTGTVHGIEGGGLETWPWHKRLLMKAALRLATRVLFISRADRERLGTTPTASASSIAYCAVDLEMHQPADRARVPVIVAISHLTAENVRRKMVLETLDAFALFLRTHPDYRLVMVGAHDSGLAQVQAHVAALGIGHAVELPGRVSLERKLELLQSSTAYLQPSRCEGFGLALLEAQACGCPVVTNHEGCIVEINGDAVSYGDTAEELAAQLAILADDPAHWAGQRARGLANVQRYSYSTRRDALRDVFIAEGLLPAQPRVEG